MPQKADPTPSQGPRVKPPTHSDFSTPEQRQKSLHYIRWTDHGILRTFWTNEMEIAPGVWRANHPSEARFRALPARGIKTVLNLRGFARTPMLIQEELLCAELGLTLVTVPMAAREAPRRDSIIDLLTAFRSMERPFLMHCKSGADRTSLASAIYLLAIENRPIAQARAMFSPRFIHFKFTRTGVLDRFLDLYETAHTASGIAFEPWLQNHYQPEDLAG